jgi:hypothetical protein
MDLLYFLNNEHNNETKNKNKNKIKHKNKGGIERMQSIFS